MQKTLYSLFLIIKIIAQASALFINKNVNVTTQILSMDNNQEKLKIAFGSCYGMLSYMNDIFKSIDAYNPHLWVWLGDAAYTDDMRKGCKNILSKTLHTSQQRQLNAH